MRFVELDVDRTLTRTLARHRHGSSDPTTSIRADEMWHATHTPHGPATLRLRWRNDRAPDDAAAGLQADAHGPGADWILRRVAGFTGDADRAIDAVDAPPVVRRALRDAAPRRFVASHNPYHQLLPVILAQRITAQQAIRQWHRLVRELGTPAPASPGLRPPADLMAPPAPAVLSRTPLWSLHPLGIEQSRARSLVTVARHADRLWDWAADHPAESLSERLRLLPGVGPWTAASVARVTVADADTVIVGDYHFAHAVGWHLAGRPRSSDDEMVELLAPYDGQRGRVQAALVAMGPAPAFGPRQRIVSIARF